MSSQVLTHLAAYVILGACTALPNYTLGLFPSESGYGPVIFYVSKVIPLAAAILCPAVPRILSDRSFVLFSFASVIYTVREAFGKRPLFWCCGDGIDTPL